MDSSKNKRHMAEQIWLSYFNRALYKRKVISEPEYNRMALMIDRRKPQAASGKPAYTRLT